MSLTTFLHVHSNSEEVSYLPWQNTYTSLKTTFHIKLKYFFWTKLLANLLLAKYLISVTAPLNIYTNNQFEILRNYFFIHLKENNMKSKICTFWETALTCPFLKVAIKVNFFNNFSAKTATLWHSVLLLLHFFYTVLHLWM